MSEVLGVHIPDPAMTHKGCLQRTWESRMETKEVFTNELKEKKINKVKYSEAGK